MLAVVKIVLVFFLGAGWLVTLLLSESNPMVAIPLHVLILILLLKIFGKTKKKEKLYLSRELEKSYDNVYKKYILPKENERKKKGAKQKLKSKLMVLSAILLIYGFVIAIMYDSLLIVAIALTISVIIAGNLTENKAEEKEDSKEFKQVVLPAFLNEMMPDLEVVPNEKNSFEEYDESTGRLKRLMTEVQEFNQAGIKTDYYLLRDNKKLYNVVSYIEHDRGIAEDYIGLFGVIQNKTTVTNTIKIVPNYEYKKINEADNVDKFLDIQSRDKSMAVVEVPRKFLEYLAEIYEKYYVDFNVKFMGNKIFFRFEKQKDVKTNEYDEEEYKRHLFTYYFAMDIMQKADELIGK